MLLHDTSPNFRFFNEIEVESVGVNELTSNPNKSLRRIFFRIFEFSENSKKKKKKKGWNNFVTKRTLDLSIETSFE